MNTPDETNPDTDPMNIENLTKICRLAKEMLSFVPKFWKAADYVLPDGFRGIGKTHRVRDDDQTKTLCGVSIPDVVGEFIPENLGAVITCKQCIKSTAVEDRRRIEKEESRKRQEEYEREQLREKEEWQRNYENHLRSPAWAELRLRVFKRANNICEGCGLHPATQVHHLTYKRVCREMLFDLVAICTPCHERIHEK